MKHLNNNILCALDLKTTSKDIQVGEIIQLCLIPLTNTLDIDKKIPLFSLSMKPTRPSLVDEEKLPMSTKKYCEIIQRGFEHWQGIEYLENWFEKLNLIFNHRIMVLCYNWVDKKPFLIKWLGEETFHNMFDWRYRDPLTMAIYLNDRADVFNTHLPFAKQDFAYLISSTDLNRNKVKDILSDTNDLIKMYKRMIKIYSPN